MIEVEGLKISYGAAGRLIEAVNEVGFSIDSGDSLALIGPSGCGKTSILFAIAGLVKPDAGNLSIAGERVDGIRRDAALILQNAGLLPWKTVWENANMSLRLSHRYPAENAAAVLEELGLAEFRDRFPAELSEGMKRRVGIARALSISPSVMLMDEPLASLDAITQERIQNLFLELWKQRGFTMVFVTHDIEEAVFLGQRIIVLSKRPAQIKAVVENPQMGELDYRESKEFHRLVIELRAVMQR
ncbi:ATP-binding cassette domain-containing protein [Candidatus Bipolaricaulota bacterium]|nr:ATP-binding cassette domain-containing protein [Candidatus Bipolaricaulota bacterium]